jgi:hypothetical protein
MTHSKQNPRRRLEEVTLRAWATQARGPRFVKLGRGRSAPVLHAQEEFTAYVADPVGYEERQAKTREASRTATAEGTP